MSQILIFLLGFIWVVIASNQVAKLFQKIKLPLITGFLLSGILIGPFVLKLVSVEATQKLYFVNDTSLAFIAFAAGAELYLKEIRNNIKSILWNTFGQMVIVFLFISTSVFYLEKLVPFMDGMDIYNKIAVAILGGTIFIARSPSSTIAVINEMRAKGRFTSMTISVTVILDVLVILLFTLCLSIANSLVHHIDFSFGFILLILFDLAITFALGFILFKIIEGILLALISLRIKAILILLLGFGSYKLAQFLGHISLSFLPDKLLIEPLLICIIASFLISNYSKFKAEFQDIVHKVIPIVYAAFFTLVGASISFNVLADTWVLTIIVFFIYLISIIVSSVISNTAAKNPTKYKKIGWMPFVTQAGVGVALIYEVSASFPEWGNQFATIIIAVIVLNQLVGPPLFKWAIKIVGESHLPSNINRTNKTALIFGLEHHSLSLARDLQKENYVVEIASLERRKNIKHITDLKIHFLNELSVKELELIDVKKFETIVLMLSDDENYRACKLIYEHIGTKIIIVRLFDSIHADKFHKLGALVVDPANAISKLIEQFVRSPISAEIIMGEDHKAMVDIKILDLDLHGIALRDLRLPKDVIILSVKRKGQILISHGYTRLRIGDIVTMVGSMESLENLSLQFEE